jgi:hypothetical protein
MKPPEKTKAALISYHGTHRVNHGISEDFCTLDGFKSAAASTALDLIFPNTKGQMYYIDAKDPIADPHGIPEEYLAQFASLRSPQGATQKATPMDPEVKKALEHMYVVSLGLLSTGKSGNEVLQKLTELGCPRDVAEKCLEAAAATLSEQQGSAHSSSAQLPRAATTTPERSTAGNSSGVARSFGTTNILIGLGLLMLGGLITGVSYSAAIGGGRYVITTGLFLVGGYQVLKGLYRLLVNR